MIDNIAGMIPMSGGLGPKRARILGLARALQLVTHDEASCYVPADMRPAIILSHWGRKDRNHTSQTGAAR